MRSTEEMMNLILQVAQELPQVRAVALNGSRANAESPKDSFQDFDIVYVVTEKEHLIANQNWLRAFGDVLVEQQPENSVLFPHSLGERYTFLRQFTDGNRLDLMLCPVSALAEWWQDDPLMTVLWDPEELLAERPLVDSSVYWVKKPSAAEFLDSCNEFWWVATYVVKGLCRGELFYASDHLYENCRGELLRLLSWQVGFATDFKVSVGKNYKYLARYLPAETMAKLYQLQDLTSLTKIWESLIATEELFSEVSAALAQGQGWSTFQSAKGVQDYTIEMRKKFPC